MSPFLDLFLSRKRGRSSFPIDSQRNDPGKDPGKEDAAHFPLTENKKSQRNEMSQRNELRPLFRPTYSNDNDTSVNAKGPTSGDYQYYGTAFFVETNKPLPQGFEFVNPNVPRAGWLYSAEFSCDNLNYLNKWLTPRKRPRKRGRSSFPIDRKQEKSKK